MAEAGRLGNVAYFDQIASSASGGTTANYSITDNISTFTHVAVHVVWAGLDATDGVIKTQWSLDGTNWEDSQSYTLGTASGCEILSDAEFTAHMFRVRYEKGSNTAGTLNVYANAKD